MRAVRLNLSDLISTVHLIRVFNKKKNVFNKKERKRKKKGKKKEKKKEKGFLDLNFQRNPNSKLSCFYYS